MNNVKGNLKTISKNITKSFLIDYSIAQGEEALVNQVIGFIPNPAAKTAVKVAGFAGYLVLAKHFTSEEKDKIEVAISDMLLGDKVEKVLVEQLYEINEAKTKKNLLSEEDEDAE